MESLFEYRWAYWNDTANRFDQTEIWMTDDEARADFWAYEDPRSYRIEHTKQDRNRTGGPVVELSDDGTDWKREIRARVEKARYGLPPFVTPTHEELRQMWTRHKDPEFRRMALETQCGRHALYELEALTASELWYLDKESATIDDARRALAKIRRRLMQEKNRIGPLVSERKQ